MTATISGLKNFVEGCDSLVSVRPGGVPGRSFNRALAGLAMLLALAIPHSIAAAQISFGLGLIAWAARDISMGRFNLRRTAFDVPLLCFLCLTVLSSVFSVEPAVSLAKLKALTLFLMAHYAATNLSARGAKLAFGLLAISALAGVGFSVGEKLAGRGMTIAEISQGSPLAGGELKPGDVIWMIAKKRVYSPEDAARVIAGHRAGETLDIEATHEGDPVPARITVTGGLKASANPLGIAAGGRSRKFRVSGFGRQFLTYAEQMQLAGLLALGLLLVLLPVSGARRLPAAVSAMLLIAFSAGLALTASRAVIASFIAASALGAAAAGGRKAPIVALAVAVTLGGLGFVAIRASRQKTTLDFSDDSTSRRVGYMKAGLKMIPRHPLLGVGMDSHKLHWKEWGFPGDYITHTHSTPVQIAMERGLPALACYFWLLWVIIASRRKRQAALQAGGDSAGAGLVFGVACATAGFLISSLFNYNFGDSEILMMLLLIVGLSEAIDGRAESTA